MKQKNNIKIIAIFLCMILYLSMQCSCNSYNTNTIRETSVEDTYDQDTPVQDTIVPDISVQETIVYDTSTVETASEVQDGIGGSSSNACIHDMLDENGFVINDPFYCSYHTITGVISSYVGDEVADKWFKNIWNIPEMDSENFTIIAFLNDFGITHDQFEIFNKMTGSVYYRGDYDADVLYSRDQNIINSYYSINDERQLRYYQKIFMYILKANLMTYVNIDLKLYKQYLEWIDEIIYNPENRYFDFSGVENSEKITESILSAVSYDNIRYWSVWDFITYFNVPQEEVEKAIINAQGFAPNVSFNIDQLYSVTQDDIFIMLNYNKEAVLQPDPVDIDNLFIRIINPVIADIPKDTSAQETTPIIYDTSAVDTISENPNN